MNDELVLAKDKQKAMERLSMEGWAYLQSNDYQKAKETYEKANDLARQLNDNVAQIIFLSYLYSAERGLGKTEAAKKHLLAALQMVQEPGNLSEIAQAQLKGHIYSLLAELNLDEGKEQIALSHLLTALGITLEGNDFPGAEIAFGKIGQIYLEQNNWEAACEMFRRALSINPQSENRVAWLALLGHALKELGEINRALESYKSALSIASSRGNIKEQAKCLISEGLVHYAQKNWQESLSCFEQAMHTNEKSADPELKRLVLTNMGNVYLKLGKLSKAEELCKKALKLAQSAGDKSTEAAFLDSLGDCFLEQGKHEDAYNYYLQAWELTKLVSDRLGERIYLANLGKAANRLGKRELAQEYFAKAIDLFEEEQSRIRSNDLKISFASNGQTLYREAIENCLDLGKRAEAIEYMGKAKSRALLDLLSNSPIDISALKEFDDENISKLISRERDLKEQIIRLEKIFGQEPEGSSGLRGASTTLGNISKLYQQRREVIDQLMLYHPNYTSLISVQTLSFPQIKAFWEAKDNKVSLPNNTAVIEFFFASNLLISVALFAGQAEPLINVLKDNKDLLALSSDINDFIEMTSTEGFDVPARLSQRLYSLLLKNVIESLPKNIDKLIIVPHGGLHHLPFAALNDGSQYLIERFSLSYLPAVSMIPILYDMERKQSNIANKYLVSAISDYSHTRNNGIVFSARFRSSVGLEDLDHTVTEGKIIVDIAAKHGGVTKLLTNDEVKKAFISSFSDYPIVHFAGHAVFNPDEPLSSGLVLSDGSILTAASILQDRILSTNCGKLLVLSACQTGLSSVTAGGDIIGLARTLIYAGMPNLILSLWEVADSSTSQLMQNLYDVWQAGKTTISEALAISQRKAIKAGQPIHAWAPFIHLGIG